MLAMATREQTEAALAEIRHACFLVRNYPRPLQRQLRLQAFHRLALTVRHALETAPQEDYVSLLMELVDGLRPRDPPPF
jgi:hypothetical protein